MVEKRLWLDFETYSEIPIKNGVYAYAQKAEILIGAYALDDEPVTVWDAKANPDVPARLAEALLDNDRNVIAHNSNFDRTVLRAVFPELCPTVDRWQDTMVMALAHSLPAALGKLCDVLKIPTDMAKDKDGRRLILLFCKPLGKNRKLRRATAETHPQDWEKFLSYAGSDILAMRECYRRIPRWNSTQAELDLWRLDQKINDRGIAIDVELARGAVRATEQEQLNLAYQTRTMTLGAVSAATQRDATLDYLRDCGVSLPNLQKATVRDFLAFGDLPTEARELLTVRMKSASTSTAKYETLTKAMTDDRRLKGTLQFCGASRTGRWAGKTFQPQNLGRPTLKNSVIDAGIAAIKVGVEDLVSDNVMELLSSAVRGCLVAPAGRKLVIADLSNIEGRVLAWLAGETWKIDAFRLYDTFKRDVNGDLVRVGSDPYCAAYAKAFGGEAGDVNKDQRQVGKVMELACFAANTQVLTGSGYKAIKDVSLSDKLWDGVEWVCHKGLVEKGVRRVVSVDGIKVTPSHQILVKNFWKKAEHLAMCENTLSLALETGSENLPWLGSQENYAGHVTSTLLSSDVLAEPTPIKYLTTILGKVKALGAMFVLKSKVDIGARHIKVMPAFAQMTTIEEGYSTEYQHVLADALTQTMQDTLITEEEVYLFTTNGRKIAAYFSNILLPLKVGITQFWNLIGLTSTKGMNLITSDLLQKNRISKIKEKSEICRIKYLNSNERCSVYDILLSGPRNRFTVRTESGHLIVHNCGYQGGVGAFVTFAAAYGIDLEKMAEAALPAISTPAWESSAGMYDWAMEKGMGDFDLSKTAWVVCDVFKAAWRQAHSAVASYWKDIETAVQAAVACPDDVICVGGDFDLVERLALAQAKRKFAGTAGHYRRGHFRTYGADDKQTWVSPCWVDETGNETKLGVRLISNRKGPTIAITCSGSWLRIRLPSGRYLCYPGIKVDDKGKISYYGVNQFTKKWDKQETYGGKIVENITQAVARDVLAYSMPHIEDAGYDICLTVHDEVISETPDKPEFNANVLAAIMSTTHEWAEGLPLAAAGFETYRYRKD